MPIITAVKPQRNGKRVNIYLDGKFGFGLDLENYVRLGLKVEQELSEREVAEIVRKGEFQKTWDKLLRFVSVRPRSEKEIRDYFKRKKVHESLHQKLFNRLKRLDLINDAAFAKWWIEQRTTFRPRGKRVIGYELRAKGVKKEVVEEALSKVAIDEEKVAKTLLTKKEYRWKGLSGKEVYLKKSQFLARKGFSWETIEKVTRKL
jgi:regulatory protein